MAATLSVFQHTNALFRHMGAARIWICAGAMAVIGSCASTGKKDLKPPQPEALQALALSQPLPDKPITLDEALARALIYNLEFKLAQTRAAHALRQADIMPNNGGFSTWLNGNATYRSNIEASVGQRVKDKDGDRPIDFFTANDQGRAYGTLSLTWNLLDFGLSYLENRKQAFYAKNSYQTSMISCASLASRTIDTFWRARAFERASAKAEWLLWRVNTGIAVSNQRAADNPESRSGELMFQRELIDLYRWYRSIYQSLSTSKAELAGLMNIPAATTFAVSIDDQLRQLPDLPPELSDLVIMAFLNRPEIKQKVYVKEIQALGNRQADLRLLPGLSVILGGESDSNSFLMNDGFMRFGANLSWNLLEFTRLNERKRSEADRARQLDLETQLIANAIGSQVVIAASEYKARDEVLTFAWKANTVQDEIARAAIARYESGEWPDSYVVKEELLRELAILRRDVDEAGHQAARFRLLHALGIGVNCAALGDYTDLGSVIGFLQSADASAPVTIPQT